MATTTEQITELRSLINDTAAPQEYDAAALSAYIESAGGDVRKAASMVWTTRAARYAGLVDITEGSSSRKNSQLYKQAIEMVKFYDDDSTVVTPTPETTGRTRIWPITR